MILILSQSVLPTFITPGLAAAGLAAVSIPVIIHLLSRRPRKPEPWAAMRFLLAAYKRHRMRMRAESLLLLLVRCLIVLLLGLALAQPLLSGAESLAGLSGGGRTVVMIVDDGLTSGATDAADKSRMDELKKTAGELLASLGPNDRAALITTSRPASAVISPPTVEPVVVARQIEQLASKASASDVPEALRLALEALEHAPDATSAMFVVLLSDFSRGSVKVEQALSGELSELGRRARLLAATPMASANNVQMAELTPDRRVAVAETLGATPVINWNLTLRRYGESLPGEQTTAVRLEGPGMAAQRQVVRWDSGQMTADVRLTTPVEQAGTIIAEAKLEPPAVGTDAIELDNARLAVAEVRQKLRVLILARQPVTETVFTPQRLLAAALQPVADHPTWPIETRTADPATLDGSLLGEADVVFVLRPDLLDEPGFERLYGWTSAGGVVWLTASPLDEPALWPQRLADAFGVTWTAGLEPVAHDPPLRLSADMTTAPELARLRSELADLVRPVQISKRLPIDASSVTGANELLLSGAGGEPILLSASTSEGGGRLLLLTTALDTGWTNLPTKPLFVPLVHEGLRAALDRLRPVDAYEPGDRPSLGGSWGGSSSLQGPNNQQVLLVRQTAPRGATRRDSGGAGASGSAAKGRSARVSEMVQPSRPLMDPGAYRGETGSLVLNVRPEAGDTRANDPAALNAWLSTCGQWSRIDPAAPAAAMRLGEEEADISWPLLWAVLALVLIETALARFVSHARAIKDAAQASAQPARLGDAAGRTAA